MRVLRKTEARVVMYVARKRLKEKEEQSPKNNERYTGIESDDPCAERSEVFVGETQEKSSESFYKRDTPFRRAEGEAKAISKATTCWLHDSENPKRSARLCNSAIFSDSDCAAFAVGVRQYVFHLPTRRSKLTLLCCIQLISVLPASTPYVLPILVKRWCPWSTIITLISCRNGRLVKTS